MSADKLGTNSYLININTAGINSKPVTFYSFIPIYSNGVNGDILEIKVYV